MTERDRLQALLVCSAILETTKKLQADFAAMKQAADDFRVDLERMAAEIQTEGKQDEYGSRNTQRKRTSAVNCRRRVRR